MALSKREVNRRKLIRYAMGISTIQRQVACKGKGGGQSWIELKV